MCMSNTEGALSPGLCLCGVVSGAAVWHVSCGSGCSCYTAGEPACRAQAIGMPPGEQHLRHSKHWRYISHHTVKYWAQVGAPQTQPQLQNVQPPSICLHTRGLRA